MQQQNEKGSGQNSPGDELDQLLDAALNQYGAVQPREGLEGRILARLRSQSAEPARHAWWRWFTAAATVAALAVIISMASRPHTKAEPSVSQRPSITLAPPNLAATSDTAMQAPKRKWHAAPKTRVVQVLPKLDQFPSPQPLSEQEKLLARYVAVYPKQVALLATLRTEELERERIEEQSRSASKDAAAFDQE
jgi:hypothetical protein